MLVNLHCGFQPHLTYLSARMRSFKMKSLVSNIVLHDSLAVYTNVARYVSYLVILLNTGIHTQWEWGRQRHIHNIYILYMRGRGHWDGVRGPRDKINTRRRPWNNGCEHLLGQWCRLQTTSGFSLTKSSTKSVPPWKPNTLLLTRSDPSRTA